MFLGGRDTDRGGTPVPSGPMLPGVPRRPARPGPIPRAAAAAPPVPRAAAAARPARPKSSGSVPTAMVTPVGPLAGDTAAPPSVDEDRPWRRLAARLGVVHLDHVDPTPEPASCPPPDPEAFRRTQALLLGEGEAAILVTAPGADDLPAVEDFLRRHPDQRRRLAIASPREIRRALVARHSAALVHRAVRAILDRDPLASAAGAVSGLQVVVIVAVAAAWLAGVLDLSRTLLAIWIGFFLGIGVLRALLAEAMVDPPVHAAVPEAELPRFAVLVPLHREAAVVGDLVAALSRLDYPADRLDLRLVVEADDAETRAAAEAAVGGTPVEILAVPAAEPRTKPKALNFALACVDAPFVTVFDAEDRPDPDQLRKAAAAFRAGGPDLAVVQAALEIDHAEGARPWLVRQFEIEYAMLFRGLLPWLARRRLFLPLGGTSNHFRRAALAEIGGWDPHNVTEDADIAVRLLRRGRRAEVIAASTLEEAPLDLRRWYAQRVRWLKGWMQTWLVHMRRPLRFHREVSPLAALSFHLLVAGQLASVLVFAPSLVLLLAGIFGFVPLFDDRTFVDDILLMAALLGFSTGVAGSLLLARRIAARGAAGRRRHRFRTLDLLGMPLYWCLISVAAYRALGELVTAPHRWNKTTHGLAERPSGRRPSDEAHAGTCAPGGREAMDGHP